MREPLGRHLPAGVWLMAHLGSVPPLRVSVPPSPRGTHGGQEYYTQLQAYKLTNRDILVGLYDELVADHDRGFADRALKAAFDPVSAP